MISFYAPASIGNFCVGFDSLGAALAPINGELLGDVVNVKAAEQDSFVCSGPYADKLPGEAHENLAFQCGYHSYLSVRLCVRCRWFLECHGLSRTGRRGPGWDLHARPESLGRSGGRHPQSLHRLVHRQFRAGHRRFLCRVALAGGVGRLGDGVLGAGRAVVDCHRNCADRAAIGAPGTARHPAHHLRLGLDLPGGG